MAAIFAVYDNKRLEPIENTSITLKMKGKIYIGYSVITLLNFVYLKNIEVHY